MVGIRATGHLVSQNRSKGNSWHGSMPLRSKGGGGGEMKV